MCLCGHTEACKSVMHLCHVSVALALNISVAGKGGTVYIGIEDSGIVTGCIASYKERDESKQGVSSMLMKLIPSVIFNQYSLEFHQVYIDFGGRSTHQVVPDKFVIGKCQCATA